MPIAYAYRDSDGIDLDSIGESPDIVRDRVLADSMGWRYERPDQYSHDAHWAKLLKVGEVVRVSVTELPAE